MLHTHRYTLETCANSLVVLLQLIQVGLEV